MNKNQSYLDAFKRTFDATLMQIAIMSFMSILSMLLAPAYISVSIFYAGEVLFLTLAIFLTIDANALSFATNGTKPIIKGVLSFFGDFFKWAIIKDAMPGYILTFSTQIAVAYVSLACGFPLVAPTLFAFSATNLAILIGMPLSALLCASINKCVKLYTGNNDIEVIHAPLKLHYDFDSYANAPDGSRFIPTRDQLLGKALTSETSNATQVGNNLEDANSAQPPSPNLN
jgi:hypothetical protein